jgi:hypothetical protein
VGGGRGGDRKIGADGCGPSRTSPRCGGSRPIAGRRVRATRAHAARSKRESARGGEAAWAGRSGPVRDGGTWRRVTGPAASGALTSRWKTCADRAPVVTSHGLPRLSLCPTNTPTTHRPPGRGRGVTCECTRSDPKWCPGL